MINNLYSFSSNSLNTCYLPGTMLHFGNMGRNNANKAKIPCHEIGAMSGRNTAVSPLLATSGATGSQLHPSSGTALGHRNFLIQCHRSFPPSNLPSVEAATLKGHLSSKASHKTAKSQLQLHS